MAKLNTDLPYIISNFYINQLINEIEAIEDTEIEMSWLSYGGSVWAGMQFADFMKSTDKKITARVTGIVASMGTALLPYFDKVVGAKQADVMIHSTLSSVTELTKKSNKELYDILKSKINEDKFEELKGVKLKDIMFLEGEDRKDIWLTGKEAKQIGLFDELIDLTPEEKVKNEAMLNELKLTASLDYKLPDRLLNKSDNNHNQKKKRMNIDELKAEHPELYAKVLKDGKDSGINAGKKAEKDRVDAWMVFNDVDPEKVKAGIESGEIMTKAQELEFMRNSQKLEMQSALENSSAEDVNPDKKTGKVKTEAEKNEAELDKALEAAGIPKEDK